MFYLHWFDKHFVGCSKSHSFSDREWAYKDFDTLQNAKNDANDITQVLAKLKFDVILKIDCNKKEMQNAVRIFGGKLKKQRSRAILLLRSWSAGKRNKLSNLGIDIHQMKEWDVYLL